MSEAQRLAAWDEVDLSALLTLDRLSHDTWRNRYGDANPNARSFGGQLLGQALMAAHQDLQANRHVSAMQFLFLQGAVPDEPIDFEVQTLQEGKRFTSRAVRGSQRGCINFNAHVTFNAGMEGPAHQTFNAFPNDPEDLPAIDQVTASSPARLAALGSYPFLEKPSMDIRIADLPGQTAPDNRDARLRFWIRTRRSLPDDPGISASAFAYLSDWFLNFSSFSPYVLGAAATRPIYLASLNHCIWFHRPLTPTDWMHVDSQSPSAAGGLGLSIAQIHDRHGVHLATTAQQSLIALT